MTLLRLPLSEVSIGSLPSVSTRRVMSLLRANADLLTERQLRGPVVVPFLNNDYANGVSP